MQQNQGNILVVDDNKSILATLDIMLSPVFNKVTLLPGPNQLITTLKKEEYNLVILDMNFSAGINTGNEIILA